MWYIIDIFCSKKSQTLLDVYYIPVDALVFSFEKDGNGNFPAAPKVASMHLWVDLINSSQSMCLGAFSGGKRQPTVCWLRCGFLLECGFKKKQFPPWLKKRIVYSR